MKSKGVIIVLSIAGVITAISAAYGVFYGINKWIENNKKREISKHLSFQIMEYLRKKEYFEKKEILKIIEVDQKLMNYFKEQPLKELESLGALSTTKLLNKYF